MEQQQLYDDYEYDANARFRPSSRQSIEDHPHPLEVGSRPNGHAYANPIMEEDEDVVTAQYVRDDYDEAPRQHPSKLPPLQTKKKKKKSRFLKKASSPRVDDDDY